MTDRTQPGRRTAVEATPNRTEPARGRQATTRPFRSVWGWRGSSSRSWSPWITHAARTPPTAPNTWPSHDTRGDGQQSPEQAAVERERGEAAEDPPHVLGDDAPRHQVCEVAEDEAAGPDVHAVAGAEDPDAEPLVERHQAPRPRRTASFRRARSRRRGSRTGSCSRSGAGTRCAGTARTRCRTARGTLRGRTPQRSKRVPGSRSMTSSPHIRASMTRDRDQPGREFGEARLLRIGGRRRSRVRHRFMIA